MTHLKYNQLSKNQKKRRLVTGSECRSEDMEISERKVTVDYKKTTNSNEKVHSYQKELQKMFHAESLKWQVID